MCGAVLQMVFTTWLVVSRSHYVEIRHYQLNTMSYLVSKITLEILVFRRRVMFVCINNAWIEHHNFTTSMTRKLKKKD